ncbi:hypothetical protein G6021_11140 [Dietzia sp. CW19]|uniref:hypothetical protein n=1 Tax=Dietzia sp. CW19 TaxID=1630634 RepID=UPI0015FDE53E|nr:hypothetical protein [Dietzia sp. CW19]MBB1051647.1 hypothetical protein [Dietzia sp. CW19]
MISIGQFVNLDSTWHKCTPTLPEFSRWANRNLRFSGNSVEQHCEPERAALVAEAAFRLASLGGQPLELPRAEDAARKFVTALPGGESARAPLSEQEGKEVLALCTGVQNFLGSGSPVEFLHQVPGCGVVRSGHIDIIRQSEIIEVKSVRRLFRSIDFRQALAYAALVYSVGGSTKVLTIFNPRAGYYFSGSLSKIAFACAGKPAVSLLEDLVEEMTSAELSR